MKVTSVCMSLGLVLLHFGCGGDSPTQSENELDYTAVELAPLLSSRPGRQFAQSPWDVNNDGHINVSDLLLVVEHLGEGGEICDGADAILHISSTQLSNKTIQVTGLGSSLAEPNIVTLILGVSVESKSVADARDAAAGAMNKVLDSLKENGVADVDIQTHQFGIHQQFDYINNLRVFRGYKVTNTVSSVLREIDRVGDALDDASDAGGQLVQVQSIQFGIDNSDGLKKKARIAAMQNALDKARTLASAGGVGLGKPISISEGSSSIPSPVYARGAEAIFDRPETPIESGQLRVTASVNVIYEIK